MQSKSPNLDRAREYLEHKAGAIKRPYGKFLRRAELRLTGKLSRRFKAQEKWLTGRIETLTFLKADEKGLRTLERKTVNDDISNLLDEMPYDEDLVADIVASARTTYRKGVDKGIEELELAKLGVSFDLVNDEAVDYLEKLRTLHLSNFRGSISQQTKDKIRKILIESADKGRTYGETARLIRDQGKAGVFSRARGELIAVNQVGTAYGKGNDDIVREFIKETQSIVQKAWSTTGDNLVTPECEANQAEGWIGINEAFSSGDENAPRASNPRCRCVTTYRTVDTQGNPT